ncbi:MAG: acetyl-CoA carboxylase biotin carboxyl carrier protein [Planctomycetes bacterium]|nr:acetyl-CoA carboxylase biotin carboxyl carrier protein [Planctomycetota bacterium]
MDLTELRKLVQLMLRADLAELELDDSKRGLRVHLKRDTGRRAPEAGMAGVMQVMPAAVPMAPTLAGPAGAPQVQAASGPPPGTEVFKSPIVGTLYRAPAPDAEPFVSVGSAFAEGAVLCIIEAMKVMNEIRSEFRGEIVEVLAESGEPVEFGQPLFLVRKG